MGVHSGKFMVLNGVSTVTDWTIEDQVNHTPFVATNTQCGTKRQKGMRSWSGGFNAMGHTPIFMPGETFSFLGYGAPNDDVLGSDGQRYSGTAMVSSVSINWAWQDGDTIIKNSAQFAGHLALTQASGVAITDATTPLEPFIALSDGLHYSTDDFAAEDIKLDDIVSMTLTLTSSLQAYTNSGTVVSNELWQGQRSGPIDWTLQVVRDCDEKPLAINQSDLALRLMVNATEYWELKYGIVGPYTGTTYNRSGEITRRTMNLAMNAANGATVGEINEPSTTTFWP